MSDDRSGPEDLFEQLKAGRSAAGRAREPIDCGHFDIRIGRDGTWHYRGSPIHRKPLVTLFSSVLVRDETGQYWLETPVERGRVDVDDAPFTAVSLSVEGTGERQRLTFTTNLDETVTAGPDHPIRVEVAPDTGEPSPYVLVRGNLEALIVRAVFYELAELAVEGPADEGGPDTLGVWSDGAFFALGPREEDAP